MNKYLKAVLVEFAWLAFLYIASYLAAIKMIGGMEEISENFHDTYVIITAITLSLFLFVAAVFVVYAVRIGFQKFGNTLTNILFIISSGYLLYNSPWILVLIRLYTFDFESNGGWTVYPPLSAKPNLLEEMPELDYLSLNHWVFLFFTISIVLVSFMEGRKWNRKKSASIPTEN